MKIQMKSIIKFLSAGFLLGSGLINAQVSLSFQTDFNCSANEYCAQLVVAGENSGEALGTSSIYFTYNPAALQYKNYTALALDNNHICPGETVAKYDAHQFDALNPGILNTTMVLGHAGSGCPNLNNTDLPVAKVCFNILNSSASSNLQFNSKHTQFNKSSDNITLFNDLVLFDKDESLDCSTISGINNPSIENSTIQLSPNPTTDIMVAHYVASQAAAKGSIKVYNVSGQEMINMTPAVSKDSNFFSIPTKNLPVGMYILQIEDASGKHSVRFVKD